MSDQADASPRSLIDGFLAARTHFIDEAMAELASGPEESVYAEIVRDARGQVMSIRCLSAEEKEAVRQSPIDSG